MHYSSPRTDWGYRDGSSGERKKPNWISHAEFIDPFSFLDFYRPLLKYAPDVMLEAKAKDLALLQLRKDLVHFEHEIAEAFDLPKSNSIRRREAP
jgi:UV DNA damage endonuclease